MKGKIVKAVGGVFYVKAQGEIFACSARKKLRYGQTELIVGDDVEIGTDNTVEKAISRRNFLMRPLVANIDTAVIVVAPTPEADFILIDKILLNCVRQKINAIIAVNKCDTDCFALSKNIEENYDGLVEKIIFVSALTGQNIDALKLILLGKTNVLCGQSGTGKTSLLNSLTDAGGQTGEISLKSGRGKHTTRHTELFQIAQDSYIVDTPGFSLLEITGIKADALYSFYPDFAAAGSCKFANCTHISEPDCAALEAVRNGKLNKERHARYAKIFNELKEKEKTKY